MDLSFVAIQALNGLASASSLFITACGLTLVFGVTRIVNFAHGSLYMVGAFTAATLVPWMLDMWFGPVIVLGRHPALGHHRRPHRRHHRGAAPAAHLRRARTVPAARDFRRRARGLQDLVIQVFGPQDILGPRAPGLRAPVEILGRLFPSYELVLIAAGPLVLGLVWLLLRKTRFGILIRAATQDRDMVAALGVNQASALYRNAVSRRVPGRSRRSTADPACRRQYGHGSVDHRGMLSWSPSSAAWAAFRAPFSPP